MDLPQNLPIQEPIPQNIPQDVPIQNAPPQNAPIQDAPIQNTPVQPAPPNPMDLLTEAIANLTAVSTLHLANNVSGAKIVMRPSPFGGEGGEDARRFLAGFTMWAMAQGTGLNVVDAQGNPIGRRDGEWIRAALSLMENEAAIWAAPAMEVFEGGQIPFGGVWEIFRTQFRARFETVNEVVDTKEKLRLLWQDQSTVPEYAAQFKQVMGRTGYSVADLRDRFYEHLHPKIKDELVHTARAIGTLDELINVASDIDTRVRQRRAEREREKRRSVLNTGTTTVPQSQANNPLLAPVVDPVVMDVDATRTREEFLRRMRGKCFGCGSTTHTKRDGHHERDICKFCLRVGHREPVCIDKFLGKPKGQKAAATVGDEEDLFEEDLSEEEEPEGLEEARVAATDSDALAQILEQQKVLMERIADWKGEDF